MFDASSNNAAVTIAENGSRIGAPVLGSFIDAVLWQEAIDTLLGWAKERQSSYVCICNVHVVVTAKQDPKFRQVVNEADMTTPDGMPLAWVLRWIGFQRQERINGPDLMWRLCEQAAKKGLSIFLYGSSDETLGRLTDNLKTAFPRLVIAGVCSPPFRPLSDEEDREMIDRINRSGAHLVFVGLGCPKQEFWMAAHRGKIRAVMIGVGAAFDYHAGTVKRAPLWMQRSGLEWLFRLMSEPKRLWKRYLVTNSLFLMYLGLGLFMAKGKWRNMRS
ncbi:MAG: WecB/TagA/CpsF family glycosyltransferase [Nitrospira sp.]|nr:WecB/TagA/CpsF family glycosyltransferase [Nitrospira sp.]